MTAPYQCRCGRQTVYVSGSATVTGLTCMDCPPLPSHEGGVLAAVDEWYHRHHTHAGVSWRHPLGSLFWLAWRPLCDYRDRRLLGMR